MNYVATLAFVVWGIILVGGSTDTIAIAIEREHPPNVGAPSGSHAPPDYWAVSVEKSL
jgi:hypothetical protein